MIEEALNDLGLRFGTDKASSHHDYLTFYERYFSHLRYNEIKVLEIGVQNGESLAVWESYFPKATIVGADIDSTTKRFSRPRVQVEIIDQSDIEQLVYLGVKYGPFDIVIEDGSHYWEHQITSLKTLFPFVRNNGIYIVEDLQTNFGTMGDSFRGVSSISCVEYLKKLVDVRVSDDQIDIAEIEDSFLRTYGRSMKTLTFYRRACVIEKWVPPKVLPAFSSPLFQNENDGEYIPLTIRAHIANQGDRQSPSGWLRSTTERPLQGFVIEPAAEIGNCLSYRARLQNGEWTNWKDNGEIAGTRGKSESLTGFSARLHEVNKPQFDLKLIGEFSGTPSETIIVQDGEDCVPASGDGVLIGIQIMLRRR